MSDPTRFVVDRFADHIRELADTNPNFNALCREYGDVVQALAEQTTAEGEGEIERLEKRRKSLNEEMLIMMQANIRV